MLRLFVFVYTSIAFVSTNANEGPVVSVSTGQLRGHEIQVVGKVLNEFLGIPFAKPPVGSLRFCKPHPLEPWPGVLDATQPKPACMQIVNQPLNEDISENCLYLNIWAPKRDNNQEFGLKPVIVWIHGGYFTVGNISRDEYNGSALAAVGDVIVVSVAYRLDVFGFLYAANENAPGNVAWHDQNLALRWVKENIENFGGDPQTVTIMGESAGSVSVGAHIISKLSRDYFSRAIMQSGSPHKYLGLHKSEYTADYAITHGKALAAGVGCPLNFWVECLKNVEASKIMDWVKRNKSFYPIYTNSTDGFLPAEGTPADILNAREIKHKFDLLIGTVANEGSAYLKNLLPSHFNRQRPVLIDKNDAKMFIAKLVNQSGINTNAVAEFYTSNIDEEQRTELRKAVAYSIGDFRIVCPVHFFGKKVALASKENRVYSYQVTHKPRVSIAKDCVDWMGVCHADDLIFTFGRPLRFPHEYTYEDYYFSLLVINVWSSFARTGNPNPSSYCGVQPFLTYPVNWPHFKSLSSTRDEVVPNYMVLDPKNFGKIVHYPYQPNCEGLWKNYFP